MRLNLPEINALYRESRLNVRHLCKDAKMQPAKVHRSACLVLGTFKAAGV